MDGRDIPLLEAQPGWAELRAVRSGRVFLLDGNRHCSRPGPRLPDALEMLAGIFHPAPCHFGHRGAAREAA